MCTCTTRTRMLPGYNIVVYNAEKKSQKILTLSGQGAAEPEQMGDISAMTVSSSKHQNTKVGPQIVFTVLPVWAYHFSLVVRADSALAVKFVLVTG